MPSSLHEGTDDNEERGKRPALQLAQDLFDRIHYMLSITAMDKGHQSDLVANIIEDFFEGKVYVIPICGDNLRFKVFRTDKQHIRPMDVRLKGR